MQFSIVYAAAVLASVASAGNLTTTVVTITSCEENKCSETSTPTALPETPIVVPSITPNISVNSSVAVLEGAADSMNFKNTGAFLAAGIAAVAMIL